MIGGFPFFLRMWIKHCMFVDYIAFTNEYLCKHFLDFCVIGTIIIRKTECGENILCLSLKQYINIVAWSTDEVVLLNQKLHGSVRICTANNSNFLSIAKLLEQSLPNRIFIATNLNKMQNSMQKWSNNYSKVVSFRNSSILQNDKHCLRKSAKYF